MYTIHIPNIYGCSHVCRSKAIKRSNKSIISKRHHIYFLNIIKLYLYNIINYIKLSFVHNFYKNIFFFRTRRLYIFTYIIYDVEIKTHILYVNKWLSTRHQVNARKTSAYVIKRNSNKVIIRRIYF